MTFDVQWLPALHLLCPTKKVFVRWNIHSGLFVIGFVERRSVACQARPMIGSENFSPSFLGMLFQFLF